MTEEWNLGRRIAMKESTSSLEEALRGTVEASGALTALLVTRQGTVAAEVGDISYMNTTALAALIAGMFTATREVARMVGENQFSILLQQGQQRHIHISLVCDDLMMVMVFEGIHKSGTIRHEARKVSSTIVELIRSADDRSRVREEFSASHFREYALNLIDRIFEP